ncbi:MAG: peptide transporter ATPase [Naasia sp.]|nr:peptide transporter ATPase [Naasia sp.]
MGGQARAPDRYLFATGAKRPRNVRSALANPLSYGDVVVLPVPLAEPVGELDVRGLVVEVRRSGTWVPAVRDVSFRVGRGERVALIGESGSGKSLTAMAIARLLPDGARIADGAVHLDGVDLTRADEATLRAIRGRRIGYIFQNPMASMDPLVRVGIQAEEALLAHGLGDATARRERVVQLLERVGIRDAATRARDFPHQFSGGMRQRAMIAAALAASPSLLIADEPTTALDVTVQARVLDLVRELSTESGLSVLMITHDLAVASQLADRLVVMYAGRVLETVDVKIAVGRPHHPYTQALLQLVPDMRSPAALPEPIPGAAVPPWQAGDGCPFASRCRFAVPECRETPYTMRDVGAGHGSACIRELAARVPEAVR